MSLAIDVGRCPDSSEWVATCAEFPLLSWVDPEWTAAADGLRLLIEDVRRDIEAGE